MKLVSCLIIALTSVVTAQNKPIFSKGDVVAIVGNGLADRMQHDGWTETLIQASAPDLQLSFRNLSLTGDRPNKFPRSKGFMAMNDYLKFVKANVIVAMFGYNESFDTKPEDHAKNLAKMIGEFRKDNSDRKIVLCSPIGHENMKDRNLPSGRANNKRLLTITEATRIAAKENEAYFIDLYHPSMELYSKAKSNLTINGIHLNQDGNRKIGEVLAKALLGKEVAASPSHEKLREAVLDKNWHWHNRYRAVDGNDIWGGRSGLKFVNGQTNREVLQHELKMLDVMTANRDPKIWATAKGRTYKVDDSNTPDPIPVISNVGGKSRSSS
ncbi:MAG: SGNH/GDSL hydrolase family protein, partial [Akkermansiaceae bacterium]